VEQSRKLRYEDIRKSLLTEYENNHIGLIKRGNGKIHGLHYLDQFFGNMLVKNITSPLLRSSSNEPRARPETTDCEFRKGR